MNYGISSGGGFGVSVPISGFAGNQGYNSYQTRGWNWTQTAGWSQPSMGYSQPVY